MNGKHIKKLGLEGKQIGLALAAATLREGAGLSRSEILDEVRAVQQSPASYTEGSVYAELAAELLRAGAKAEADANMQLRREALPYRVWGAELIDAGAHKQMETAMRLPIARAGALMPDAHVGYGLPIGGVLATEGAVVPYAVGVDIGCSMMLSVLPVPPESLATEEAEALLLRHTRFGTGAGFEPRNRLPHPVLDESTWNEQKLLGHLRDKAASQIGSSGSGNHFVEFGVLDAPEGGEEVSSGGLPAGRWLAVLSHSGSRGFGAQVAGHFCKVAEARCAALPKEARKLAWLELGSEEGEAYWRAMNLAGRYALANHEQIHARLAGALGAQPLAQVSNSHNLAWKQQVGGREMVVHRKGATPAEAGRMGLIPGSMADPSYVVRGRGNLGALESSSHGAGRQMGRKAATEAISKAQMQDYLDERGVTLIGGGRDETPHAYKSIDAVLAQQTDLVDVVARFTPKVVRMAGGER